MTRSRLLVLAALVLALAGFVALDLGRFFSLAYLKTSQAGLSALYNEAPWTVRGAFFALYVAVASLSLPGAAILTLFTIVAAALKGYQTRKQNREEHQDETNIQAARKSLAENDGAGLDAAASDQHDRVQRALCGSAGRGDDQRKEVDPRQPLQ